MTTTYEFILTVNADKVKHQIWGFSNYDSAKDREEGQRILKSSKHTDDRLDYVILASKDHMNVMFNEKSALQQQVISKLYKEYGTTITQEVSLVNKGMKIDTAITLRIYTTLPEFRQVWEKLVSELN